MSQPTDYIAEAITEAFGDRCPDFNEGCHCCRAWAQYDALRKQVSDAVGALEAAREFIADEYRDDRYTPDGEWLPPEARPLHNRLCEALATLTGGKADA